MNTSYTSSDRTAAICGMAWFVLIIDACFTWSIPDKVRLVVGFLFVLTGSVIQFQSRGFKLTNQVLWPVLSVLMLMLYFVCIKMHVYAVFKYLPLLLVSLWSPKVLMRMYSYFKKFVIFYAILSIVVEPLFMSGLWKSLPYLTIYPPQDFVQEAQGTNNYFYGLFCIPYNINTGLIYRACGPLREGGHWIFFLGFVYFVEKALYNKRNVWLIICGLLTLSPNFIVFFCGTEVYCFFKQKRFKPLLGVVGFIVIMVLAYPLLPDFIKSEVSRIVLERTLENSLSNLNDEGYMAIFDGRAGFNSLSINYTFERSDIYTRLFGLDQFEAVMSDYRWMLMYAGYIGTILVLWCTYCYSIGRQRNLFGIFLFLFAITIFSQRAWMFNQVYIWAMMLLVLNEKYLIDREARYVKKQKRLKR